MFSMSVNVSLRMYLMYKPEDNGAVSHHTAHTYTHAHTQAHTHAHKHTHTQTDHFFCLKRHLHRVINVYYLKNILSSNSEC